MKHKKENYVLTFYTIFMLVMAIAELFLDFSWTILWAKIGFYLIMYILTAFVCMSASKFDKRIEWLVYVILISTAILGGNTWIFISGIAVIVCSRNQVNYTSKLIVMISAAILFASTQLFGMVDSELVTEKVVKEDYSPNDQYVVTQVFVTGNVVDTAYRVFLHKDIGGIIDVSYKLQLNDDNVKVEWIDDRTFTVDGEVMEVRF